MAIKLPESARKMLQDKAYGHVVTSAPNGRPQATMVWVDAEGDEVLFNTAEGREKARNLRRDPRVVISIHGLAHTPMLQWSGHVAGRDQIPRPDRTNRPRLAVPRR